MPSEKNTLRFVWRVHEKSNPNFFVYVRAKYLLEARMAGARSLRVDWKRVVAEVLREGEQGAKRV